MPFYEYKCSNCGFELEEMQKMSDLPLIKCPECDKDTLQKLIGTGGGLIFKGSGFYLTDYKKKPTSESSTPQTSKTQESKKEMDKSKDKSSDKSSDKPTDKSTDKSKDKSRSSTDTQKTEITKKEK